MIGSRMIGRASRNYRRLDALVREAKAGAW